MSFINNLTSNFIIMDDKETKIVDIFDMNEKTSNLN
jgi:hypothetical protein